MDKKKYFTILVLMFSSVMLLIALQILWLRNSYQNASEDFQKETNLLFQNTIYSMHDSIIQKSIERVPADSINKSNASLLYDSLYMHLPPLDSIHRHVKGMERRALVSVFIDSDNRDSIQHVLKPFVRKMQYERQPGNFIIKLGTDSLTTDSIKKEFSKALNEANIDVTFHVLRLPGERMEKRIFAGPHPIVSSTVQINPLHSYSVSFTDINVFLLKNITPQILFSFFLTVLTIVSFIVLYRNLQSQQKLIELKNDFISNVTHELKTPVATVSAALEALKNFNALNDATRSTEYIDIARNELSRLTLMTDKILKTSVFESKGGVMTMTTVDLHFLIEEIISSMKVVFEKSKANFNYTHEGSDFKLQGNEEHLTTLIYNLVDNALKYSDKNPSITVKLVDQQNKLVLSIQDNGIGIPSAYKKKIFEKFFRVPTGDVHTTKGYGLGLSYVSEVVKSHGGDIIVESEISKGSCFIINLPKRHEN
jgi:two-component system, OmpR family, phosphate regulon sensor histidine kinase PhoR